MISPEYNQGVHGEEKKRKQLISWIGGKKLADLITRFSTELLTTPQWKTIYDLRYSNQTVRTCGNAGSYKIYGMPISELLSDNAIAGVPQLYEGAERVRLLLVNTATTRCNAQRCLIISRQTYEDQQQFRLQKPYTSLAKTKFVCYFTREPQVFKQ
jgi:hypothetical protein